MSLCEAVIFLLCQTCHCYEHLNESRDICPWCSSLFKVRKSVQLVGTRVACMLNWDILYSTNKHTFSLVPRYWQKIFLKYIMWGDFPDGPVVNTPCFQCTSMGLNPGQGTKILHATWQWPFKEEKKKSITQEKPFPQLLAFIVSWF